jgi:hypothetical protein
VDNYINILCHILWPAGRLLFNISLTMKTIITILLVCSSLIGNAQDSTGKYSIKLTGPQIEWILATIDSSALPAKIANAFKADILKQARDQVKPPVNKEGKKD